MVFYSPLFPTQTCGANRRFEWVFGLSCVVVRMLANLFLLFLVVRLFSRCMSFCVYSHFRSMKWRSA